MRHKMQMERKEIQWPVRCAPKSSIKI